MAKRPSRIRKSDATNFMKSALDVGFGRVRVVEREDGRLEYIAEKESAALAENAPTASADAEPNPWDELAH